MNYYLTLDYANGTIHQFVWFQMARGLLMSNNPVG